MTDLKRLRELAMAATRGDWEFERVEHDEGDFSWEINNDFRFIAIRERDYKKIARAKFDADYIAAANPQTILSLIDRIEKLE